MIKIIPLSNDSTIGEYHLMTISSALNDALELCKKYYKNYEQIPYVEKDAIEIHLQNYYSNQIVEIEELINEINQAIENISDEDKSNV